MDNKKPGFIKITLIGLPLAFYLAHDCEIVNPIKVDKQTSISINNDLICNHKYFIGGQANTITQSGDNIGRTNTTTLLGGFI